MMTVRLPNGRAVVYNRANHLDHSASGSWVLRGKEKGEGIAFIQASAGVIVEFEAPCKVYNTLQGHKIVERDSLTWPTRFKWAKGVAPSLTTKQPTKKVRPLRFKVAKRGGRRKNP
mgnify:CR=1 FL=1